MLRHAATIFFAIALIAAAVAAWIVLVEIPEQERRSLAASVEALSTDDPARRASALDAILQPDDTGHPRILRHEYAEQLLLLVHQLPNLPRPLINEIDLALAHHSAWEDLVRNAPVWPTLLSIRLEYNGITPATRGAPELDLLRNTISAMTPAEAAAALRPLIASPNSAHRAEALELAVVSLGPEAEPLIAETLVDADHQIAALSWRLLAAIEPLSGRTANWRDAPDEVADSILLAVALTNPEEAQRLFESIRADPQAAARFRPILDWLDAVATRIDRASLPPPAPDAHERAHTLYGHARSARALLESESP